MLSSVLSSERAIEVNIATRGAGVGIKPGVERSATPGTARKIIKARGAADSRIITIDVL
jgi:hypothetical protein